MQTAARNTDVSRYARRAQYHDPENAFLFKWTPVPRRQFLTDRDQVMDPAAGTAEVLLDSSDALDVLEEDIPNHRAEKQVAQNCSARWWVG